MAIPEFNLLDEPWILASDSDGNTVKLSLISVFEKAHGLTALSGELPTQDAVILRLLLAVLHGAFPYRDEKGEEIDAGGELDFWREVWSRGSFPTDAIKRYLNSYRERFWLFHPERPFYQVAGMSGGTPYKASKLVGELSESNHKLRLFQSRGESAKAGLSYDEAARWLPYLIAFDDNSSKATPRVPRLPTPGAGWLGKLGTIYAVGSNLFETLMLNFVIFDDNDMRWEVGGAAWELESTRSGERVEISLPKSQSALLTVQSRRVLLERDNGAVTGFRLLGGDFFSKDNAFAEQMTAWYSPKDRKDVYAPKRHRSDRRLWRDYSSFLGGTDGSRKPGIVRWLAILEEEGLIEKREVRLRASAVMYGDSDYSVIDLFDDMISVNAGLLSKLGEIWNSRITREIEITEKLVSHLGYFAMDLAVAAGDGKNGEGMRGGAKEEAYFRLDNPFRAWLAAIDPAKSELDGTCAAWRETAAGIIMRLGRELIAEAGDAAFTGRTVTKKDKRDEIITAPGAYNKFTYLIRKTQKE